MDSKMKSLFANLYSFIAFLLGFVPGVYLLVVGGWKIVIFGILVMIILHFLISPAFALINLIVSPLVMKFRDLIEKNKFTGAGISYFFSQILGFAVISIVSLMIMGTFERLSSGFSIYMVLLWSYLVALASWQSLASKEDGASTQALMFIANIAYLACLGIIFLEIPIGYGIPYVFGGIMLLGLIIITIVQINYIKNHSVYYKIEGLLKNK